MMNKPKIIAIVGPTASGKTACSIELAKKYNGEIVSADSRQVYRGMDIGTAKPSRDGDNGQRDKGSFSPVPLYLSQKIPHHLLDIKNPNEDYTVAEYKKDAENAISEILRKNKLPILVGGTGLYIRAVLENLDIPKIKANPELRAQIEKEIAEKGLAAVFKKLIERDPEAAYIVDPKNPRRVVRALEVAISTGEPFTAQRKKCEPLYDALKIGVNPLRAAGIASGNARPEILRERIDHRVDVMMQDGLVTETENLIKKYGLHCAAFDAIGYREIIDYLNGKTSIEKAVSDMKINTWRYAKRQMTWFKRDPEIQWVNDFKEADHFTANFLAR
jgi:tRNA dimethylallyltransferase